MNYIQRLLDAATPMVGNAPVAGWVGGGSPVLAADPRLAVFPDLVEPRPAQVLEPSDAAPAAATRQRIPAPEHPPLAMPAPAAHIAPAAVDAPARHGAPAPAAVDDAPRRASPLQRLAESAPLERPHRPAPPLPPVFDRPLPGPIDPTEPAHAPPMAAARADAQEDRSDLDRGAVSALAEPFRITSDQFRPSPADSANDTRQATLAMPIDAPRPAPADAPATVHRSAAPQRPPRTESADAELPGPRGLEPAPVDIPSPLARFHDGTVARPAPEPAHQAPERRPPERIVERIREVPVAPPTTHTPLTAQAQSVIGSLDTPRFGRWRPRQEGF